MHSCSVASMFEINLAQRSSAGLPAILRSPSAGYFSAREGHHVPRPLSRTRGYRSRRGYTRLLLWCRLVQTQSPRCAAALRGHGIHEAGELRIIVEGFPGLPGVTSQKTDFRQGRFVRLDHNASRQDEHEPTMVYDGLTSTALRIVIDI